MILERFRSLMTVGLLPLLVDPRVSQIGHLDHQGQVVAAKTVAGLPLVPVLVDPQDGDVLADALGSVVR